MECGSASIFSQVAKLCGAQNSEDCKLPGTAPAQAGGGDSLALAPKDPLQTRTRAQPTGRPPHRPWLCTAQPMTAEEKKPPHGRRGQLDGSRGRAPRGRGRETPRLWLWTRARTHLLVRDPLRLLQAERASEGAVLRHHAQAAGRAHKLLGVATRGHPRGHVSAGAPHATARAEPRKGATPPRPPAR